MSSAPHLAHGFLFSSSPSLPWHPRSTSLWPTLPKAPPNTPALPVCLISQNLCPGGALVTDLAWLGPQFACTVIAILLHFLYLCTFSWALLEALHLYRALTEVRDVNAGPMRFYYMLGWGVPAFITGTATPFPV